MQTQAPHFWARDTQPPVFHTHAPAAHSLPLLGQLLLRIELLREHSDRSLQWEEAEAEPGLWNTDKDLISWVVSDSSVSQIGPMGQGFWVRHLQSWKKAQKPRQGLKPKGQ